LILRKIGINNLGFTTFFDSLVSLVKSTTMTVLKFLSTLSLIFLTACSSKNEIQKENKLQLQFKQYSTFVKDTFYIDVQLPQGYYDHPKRKYPTLFFIDGNFFFPMMSAIIDQYETAGLMVPTIVVGIGYKSFKTMDSLRVRDYLYPQALPSDELEASGGAQNFYNYLTQELIPEIDKNYRNEQNNRSLLGHSFGGYFVLYSMLKQLGQPTQVFKHFISASPTLWYHNFYLNQIPAQLAKYPPSNLSLLMSIGGKEDSTWSVKPLQNLEIAIQNQRIKGLEFSSRVYNHLDHMDVAIPTFTQGLRAWMKTQED
jgi:uncharacterized protein